MPQRLTQVDSFTAEPFAGNPAAVCVLEKPAEEAWMKRIAREMNLSETAFVVPRPEGGFGLRWFTPAVEVELCGHATLASAHVLWQDGHLAPGQPAVFHTLSGELRTERGDDGWILMDFPADPPDPVMPPEELVPALGVEPTWVGRGRFDYLVEVESEAIVRGLDPDLATMARLGGRGVLVTARADKAGFDFVSRCFFPAAGVPEDPVTGSAHCCLGPYWAERLGKDDLVAFQASDRGGTVGVTVRGARVTLRGQAVTVATIELLA